MKDKMRPPQVLVDLAAVFAKEGFSVYMVGGAVRDFYLGKKAEDLDVATDAPPEKAMSLFKKVIPTGIAHGTVTIFFKGARVECTTFRTEKGYSDSRHPDEVLFSSSIEEDLARRDFTMNAIAVRLPDGKVVDPFGGREAIKKRIIETVGDAQKRFLEDGLRPIRCARFAAQTGFDVAEETLAAIPSCLASVAAVSKERVRDELVRMLSAGKPSIAFRLMERTGLLSLILPELAACRGVEQLGFHKDDVLDHLLNACDLSSPENLNVRLAALFHDIGKPECREWSGEKGRFTFYNHENVSAKKAESILTALRFPGKTVKAVSSLIENHMFHYESSWSAAAVRRFMVKAGVENIPDLFRLRAADSAATFADDPACEDALRMARETDLPENRELRKRIEKELKANAALSLKDLAVNGRDLMAAGIPQGPKMGLVLRELMQAVIADPACNTRERLTAIAKAYSEKLNAAR